MDWLPDLMTPLALLLAIAVTFTGGFVKGAVGFAMPLVMVSGLGMFIEPKLVVAGIILPIVISNIAQVARAGRAEALSAAREYRLYIGIVCAMILISAQFLTRIPSDVMLLVLGIPVVVLCAIQLAGLRLIIPPHRRAPFSVFAGLVSGTLGGLAGTWGPPTVLYLLAVETPKARQMAVQGVIYGLGSVALLAGHLQSGILNRETAPPVRTSGDPSDGGNVGGVPGAGPVGSGAVPQGHADGAGGGGAEPGQAGSGPLGLAPSLPAVPDAHRGQASAMR